ncbi:hypothetical protein T4C_8754 [Trichinella pseudospiralis]|uniref:Uncharacterized protein n=1 Tax=Trichinella pseudospiralis TaxID=6337 RepID=A0A0V1GF94_TRIPS|nr:hypothetical protein T4C_8754 [Trichinella pseudospiralis]
MNSKSLEVPRMLAVVVYFLESERHELLSQSCFCKAVKNGF